MRVVCMGRREVAGRELCYSVLAEEDQAETERYGVRIEAEDGEAAQVLDVTASGARILELAELLVRNDVTPVTLWDVVVDWL